MRYAHCSPLTGHGSRSRFFRSALMASVAMGIAMPAMAQQTSNPSDAQRGFVDHDFTTTVGSATTLNERFVDIKTPGDLVSANSRSYVVGTIDVDSNVTSPTFSGTQILVPTIGWSSFATLHQVGILQCRDASQAILWQKYFYGSDLSTPARWTNLRAVAVWPTDAEADTRVVICGETTHTTLPLGATLAGATTTAPTGFVSVFDGAGNLLWTHRFYSNDYTQHCAITDVGIRVEQSGGVTYDVVTYCGLSTHGNPGGSTPLEPLLPFDAPIGASGSGYTGAGGDTNAGAGFWDGIVGRVRFNRSNSTITRDFHSIVGGSEADGLFGLTLLDEDRFVVVGNTRRLSSTASAEAFPFTGDGMRAGGTITHDWNNSLGNDPDYCVGTITMFDASPTRSSNKLVLETSLPLGHIGTEQSLARDIWSADRASGNYDLFVVGSTDDDATNGDFISSINASPGAQPTLGGGQDGFLAHALGNSTPIIAFTFATFFGGSGDDGLSGVSGWNGSVANCSVVGTLDNSGAGTGTDLVVASYWDLGTTLVRSDVVGSSDNDIPTALGSSHAMTGSLAYPTTLGEPAGGGISVDSVLRTSIVGSSPSAAATTNFPNFGGGDAPLGGVDAVRAVYDLLPAGVWRTDGTGTRTSGFGSVPQPSGYFGGTTPSACLSAFGQLPGEPIPDLRRISIDYVGPAPGSGVSGASVQLSNFLPPTTPFTVGVIQFGFPGTPGSIYSSAAEIWAYSSPSVLYSGYGLNSLNWPLSTLPSGSFEFTVQGVFLLASPMACDPGASVGTVASPGLVLSY
jgi:hypothetical protein